ncbi:hypothetical protein BDZ94DRAFT_325294 [Collybia nuda]|uniref:Uncharacterized protein n=1 Tax=Collybia nuda TaxID=64659 RepID=A0A9P5YB13_9AGAR|nr:hypothetical protein BDZ94DRAFT_325294 [Collybia nuda]
MSHLDNNYSMNPPEGHYTPQQQRQQQWAPHLLTPSHTQASFTPPVPNDQGQHYPPFYHPGHQQQQSERIGGAPGQGGEHLNRASSSSLSLNLSSLTVTSPTNLSPINPPSGPALSPATPISPSGNPFGSHGHPQHHHIQPPFQFDQSAQGPNQQQQGSPVHYDEHGNGVLSPPPGSSAASSPYDSRRTPGPSRSSSSSSSSQMPRKRSFTTNPSASVLVEENMYDEARDAAMELASQSGYDDMEMRAAYGAGGGSSGSPVEGSGSTSGGEEALGGAAGHIGGIPLGIGSSMNILGKPMATNNFVTKLYQ